MRRPPALIRRKITGALTAFLVVAAAVFAQAQGPHIAYVFPAGGRLGETVRIAVGGQQLRDATDACISGDGVTVKVIERVQTLNRKQRAALTRSLAALRRARPTIEIVDLIAEIRRELVTQRTASPALADTVIVEVTVAADATPGPRELRLATSQAVTNPLRFDIGRLPEVAEGAMPEVPVEVKALRALGEAEPLPEPDLSKPVDVRLPAVVNGQILPGSTDRYRFQARRGQKIVVAVEARVLIPYIADGVPGWFTAAVSVRDARGRELDYADHFRSQPDPVLCVTIPEDGEYFAEVRDSIYRGREDFVYRITLGELPFVTSIFPLGGQAGTRVKCELLGWNLPTRRITQDAAALTPGVHPLILAKGSPDCNLVPFEVGDLPEIQEARSHGAPSSAQALTLPVIVNGRIDAPGQWDVYRFEAAAGDEVVAQVRARRLGSPLDSLLLLTDAKGAQIAVNDDSGSNQDDGLETHHADSYIRARLPAAGTYYLHLGDIQQQGGPEYAYRLRVSAPRPDFELRIAPSAINFSPGENIPVAVYALRQDGFAGDIRLALKNAPAGLVLSGGQIGAGRDGVLVTLAALAKASPGRTLLSLQGRATIGGREVVREAVPAEDMMQAFLWRHLVRANALHANVPSGTGSKRPIRLLGELPLAISAGSSAKVHVDMTTLAVRADEPVHFELVDPPQGISLQPSEPKGADRQLVLACDTKKAKPGLKGNLIAVAYILVTPPPWSPTAVRPRFSPEELMQAVREAPKLPDMKPSDFLRQDTDFDGMSLDLESPMHAAPMKAAPKPEPAAAEARPQQRVVLGTLPAISFAIVEPHKP